MIFKKEIEGVREKGVVEEGVVESWRGDVNSTNTSNNNNDVNVLARKVSDETTRTKFLSKYDNLLDLFTSGDEKLCVRRWQDAKRCAELQSNSTTPRCIAAWGKILDCAKREFEAAGKLLQELDEEPLLREGVRGESEGKVKFERFAEGLRAMRRVVGKIGESVVTLWCLECSDEVGEVLGGGWGEVEELWKVIEEKLACGKIEDDEGELELVEVDSFCALTLSPAIPSTNNSFVIWGGKTCRADAANLYSVSERSERALRKMKPTRAREASEP